jgi:hypothetical protein
MFGPFVLRTGVLTPATTVTATDQRQSAANDPELGNTFVPRDNEFLLELNALGRRPAPGVSGRRRSPRRVSGIDAEIARAVGRSRLTEFEIELLRLKR